MSDWYKMNPVDWNDGTDDLTLEQEAAYLRICHAIYITERAVRDNPFVIAGLLRCNERKAKRILAELIEAGKLVIEDGHISNRRAVEEVSNRNQTRTERKSAGSRGGVESGKARAKALKDNEQGQAIASTPNEPDKRRGDKNTAAQYSAPAFLYDKLIQAASVNGNCHPGLATGIGPITALIDAGHDLEKVILPTIRSRAKPTIRSWSYFVAAIEQASQERAAIKPAPVVVETDWRSRLDVFRSSGTWAHAWGPKPGEAGCKVPSELLARAA